MKRISLLLVIAMLLSCVTAFATGEAVEGADPASEETMIEEEQSDGLEQDEAEEGVGFQPGTELMVASATEMAGFFATDMWGNNTSDLDVRMLLHGYTTIAKRGTRAMAPDGVAVENIELMDEAPGGGMNYTFTLNPDLVYNDGSPLTAKDYLFSLLLSCSPHVTALGGMSRDFNHIAGYTEYREGAASGISGLRLIDDHSFSMEILPDYLPFFHSLSLLSVTPYPMAVIAPGCDVVDDGSGAHIEGDFSEELLEKTLLDPETGYLFNPRVTSGPYQLESYDAQTHTATFTANPHYLGNFEGKKPSIERVILTAAKSEDMAKLLEDGTVDIVHKVVDAKVYAALDALDDAGKIGHPHSYLRSGFGYLSFACEEGPTSSVAVRRAIAASIDKKAFVESTFAEGLAMPVYGYYGLAQWMIGGAVDVDGEMRAMTDVLEELSPDYSITYAKALLVGDGWTLNERGELFSERTDGVRYRNGDQGLEPLTIKWAKVADNGTADSIAKTIEAPFKELGIGLEITEMPFGDMLKHYYRMTDRTYNMFSLASNFTYVFDPYYDFNVDDQYQGWVNCSGLKDQTLMDLAWEMRRTEEWDTDNYLEKWLAFQARWLEMMPMVPLYSNVYYDFCAKDVQGYSIESFATLSQALNYVYIADEPIEIGTQAAEAAVETDEMEIVEG